MKGQNRTKYFGLFECYQQPVVSWWLAEGYPLMLSAKVLRTFRKLSILTFWERYLLTFSGLSANVLLTLFCWVGGPGVLGPKIAGDVPWATENWTQKDRGENGILGPKRSNFVRICTQKIVFVLVDEKKTPQKDRVWYPEGQKRGSKPRHICITHHIGSTLRGGWLSAVPAHNTRDGKQAMSEVARAPKR